MSVADRAARQALSLYVMLTGEQAMTMEAIDTGTPVIMIGAQVGGLQLRFHDAKAATEVAQWWDAAGTLATQLPWETVVTGPATAAPPMRIAVTLDAEDARGAITGLTPSGDKPLLRSAIGPMTIDVGDRAAYESVRMALREGAALAQVMHLLTGPPPYSRDPDRAIRGHQAAGRSSHDREKAPSTQPRQPTVEGDLSRRRSDPPRPAAGPEHSR